MRDRGNFEVIASMPAGPSHSSRIQAALGVPGKFGPLHQLQHWFHCGDSMEAMPAMQKNHPVCALLSQGMVYLDPKMQRVAS